MLRYAENRANNVHIKTINLITDMVGSSARLHAHIIFQPNMVAPVIFLVHFYWASASSWDSPNLVHV